MKLFMLVLVDGTFEDTIFAFENLYKGKDSYINIIVVLYTYTSVILTIIIDIGYPGTFSSIFPYLSG